MPILIPLIVGVVYLGAGVRRLAHEDITIASSVGLKGRHHYQPGVPAKVAGLVAYLLLLVAWGLMLVPTRLHR